MLSLKDFYTEITNPSLIYGGGNGCQGSDGGCTCSSPGGTASWGSYSSDTQYYDGNGTLTCTQFHRER